MTTADSVVLLAYGDQTAIKAHRRSWSGAEIDISFVSTGPTERYAGAFDPSGFDGAGWKMADLSDTADGNAWRTLWLRSLDPQTLNAPTPDLQIVVSDGHAVRTPMIVRSGARHLVAWLRVKLLNLQGTVQRTWDVLADSSASSPSVAAIGSRYLIVWLDGPAHTELRQAIIDPAAAGSTISGIAVPGITGTQGAPYLVPGHAQILCIYPSKPASAQETAVFVQRFDAEGALLDSVPIPLCPAPGNQGLVSGIWDSNQYLVAWSNRDPGATAIFGGRIAASGTHFDTTGFLIRDGYKGPVSLARDENGRVVAAYGGNCIRTIDDLIPLLDESTRPDDPSQSDGVIALQIGLIVPNPGLGQLHLDASLPLRTRASIRIFDAAGRLVTQRVAEAADLANGWTWDGRGADGQPAPSGIYFIKVPTAGRDAVRRGVLLR